jgi:hypothetical protein
MYQNFIIPYLYEAQHVSGDTSSIIRSPKLHLQSLIFHTWKAHCAWQRPPSTRPSTFHVWNIRGCQCSFRLLMMEGVSPETCWASYKYGIIKFWYIIASCWIFLYEMNACLNMCRLLSLLSTLFFQIWKLFSCLWRRRSSIAQGLHARRGRRVTHKITTCLRLTCGIQRAVFLNVNSPHLYTPVIINVQLLFIFVAVQNTLAKDWEIWTLPRRYKLFCWEISGSRCGIAEDSSLLWCYTPSIGN